MRICVITSSYPRTEDDSRNAGVFVRDFALELQTQGHEVLVITPRKSGPNDLNQRVPVYFFPTFGGETELVSLSPSNPVHLFKLFFLLASGSLSALLQLRKFRPHVVLACWAVPSGIFALLARKFLGTPYQVWTLGSDIWKIGQYPFGRKILRTVLTNAEKFYADGLELARTVSQISGRPCEFLPSARRLPQVATKLHLDSGKIHFLMVGRYHPDKGPDILIQAFDLLRKKYSGVQLHLFGGGPMEDELKDLIQKRQLFEVARLGGYLDGQGVAAYLAACDCLVIPSRIESIPLVFSESIKANCPLVVTDVGDMGELCRKYHFGLVARREDPEDLAEVLIEFIKARNRKRLLAPPVVKAMFDLTSIAKQFLKNVSY